MSEEKDEVIANPDPHFEPIVNLPAVQTKTLEEDEEELLKLRAKLYRYDSVGEPREWKERGTGEVKILKHLQRGTCRLLMRRDKTLKICANHLVLPSLDLKPNCGSDRAWVWSTPADYADEESKQELLAIRFGTAENAQKFREIFEEAKALMSTKHAAEGSPKRESETSEKQDKEDIETTTIKNGTDKDKGKDTVNDTDKDSDKEGDKKKEDEATDSMTTQLDKLKVNSTGDSAVTSSS
jgi:Ran-binding protein 1